MILAGRIDDKNLGAYYKACDVFCLPSITKNEAFGLVQCEAMSFSRPVVATTIPDSGTSWVNRHGFSGLNVIPKNSLQLAKAIQSICKNKNDYYRFSKNAKMRFDDYFRIDKTAKIVFNLYESAAFRIIEKIETERNYQIMLKHTQKKSNLLSDND